MNRDLEIREEYYSGPRGPTTPETNPSEGNSISSSNTSSPIQTPEPSILKKRKRSSGKGNSDELGDNVEKKVKIKAESFDLSSGNVNYQNLNVNNTLNIPNLQIPQNTIDLKVSQNFDNSILQKVSMDFNEGSSEKGYGIDKQKKLIKNRESASRSRMKKKKILESLEVREANVVKERDILRDQIASYISFLEKIYGENARLRTKLDSMRAENSHIKDQLIESQRTNQNLLMMSLKQQAGGKMGDALSMFPSLAPEPRQSQSQEQNFAPMPTPFSQIQSTAPQPLPPTQSQTQVSGGIKQMNPLLLNSLNALPQMKPLQQLSPFTYTNPNKMMTSSAVPPQATISNTNKAVKCTNSAFNPLHIHIQPHPHPHALPQPSNIQHLQNLQKH